MRYLPGSWAPLGKLAHQKILLDARKLAVEPQDTDAMSDKLRKFEL